MSSSVTGKPGLKDGEVPGTGRVFKGTRHPKYVNHLPKRGLNQVTFLLTSLNPFFLRSAVPDNTEMVYLQQLKKFLEFKQLSNSRAVFRQLFSRTQQR